MNLSYINPYRKLIRVYRMTRMVVPEFEEPVTDRNSSDVEKALEMIEKKYSNLTEEEKLEWDSGLKGCLNYTDLNRIEQNLYLLSLVLEVEVETKYWEPGDIPVSSDYSRIRNNVETIRNAYTTYKDTPKTPEEPLVTYEKYNDIEKILLDIYTILLAHFHYYCGELYSGDETGGLL